MSGLREAQRPIPENVRALSWVSFANDAASELAYPVVPLFLTSTLGAPVAVVGLIEGIAEGAAVGLRGLAGWLSDRRGGRRRPWLVAGYAISAAARPVVAVAPAWGFVLAGRLADRVGKATRTAPRDALIRESTPLTRRGAAFGYHRALDTAGAVIAPLVGVALLSSGVSLRSVLWVAVAPGIATVILLRSVREARSATSEARTGKAFAGKAALPASYWKAVAIATLFAAGNSSDVFLLLRARDLGLGAAAAVGAYALYNLVYASSSWPLGALSDRIPRHAVLAGGLAVFAAVYLGFALAGRSSLVWPLFAIYGVYIGATEGVVRAWIGDFVPEHGAGTAFGIFAAATGAGLLVASITAGLLWSHVGHSAPFVFGSVMAALALVALLLTGPRPPTPVMR